MALHRSCPISGGGYEAPANPFLQLDYNFATFMPSLAVSTSSSLTQWFVLFIDDTTKNKGIRFVNTTSVRSTFTYKFYDENGTQIESSYTSSKDNSGSYISLTSGTRYVVGRISSPSGNASNYVTLE